jgi:hypothetical protein
MAITQPSKGAEIRARLDHPVIDADGHTVEFEPAFLDHLKHVGGADIVERYTSRLHGGSRAQWYAQSLEARREHRTLRPPWWALPTKNTLDRATATLANLLRERLDDLGIDFTILYPTRGLSFVHLHNDEMRRATCRALNLFHADIFREHADRMTPAAVIPMHTPEEAIEELEYAVKDLGLKAAMIAGHGRRSIPVVAREAPQMARTPRGWIRLASTATTTTIRSGPSASSSRLCRRRTPAA